MSETSNYPRVTVLNVTWNNTNRNNSTIHQISYDLIVYNANSNCNNNNKSQIYNIYCLSTKWRYVDRNWNQQNILLSENRFKYNSY